MSNGLELVDTHEQIPDEIFFGVLSGAGNNELKIALALVMYTNPSVALDGHDLARTFNLAQGSEPAWELRAYGAAEYCSKSFVPLNVAEGPDDEAVAGGAVERRWQASGDHQEQIQAMLGFVADWSLKHDGLSPRVVFGSTSSPTQVRSPQVRYRLYQTLRDGEDDLSLTELTRAVGDLYSSHPLQAVNGQVSGLVTSHVLRKLSNRRGDDPLITLADPAYHGHNKALEATSPATQALYRVTGQLGANAQIHLNALMDLVAEADPSVDTIAFRRMLRLNIGQQIGYPGLHWVDHEPVRLDEQTEVAFVPEVEEAIAELLDGLERIRQGEGTQIWSARAREIARNPTEFHRLVEQGHKASAQATTPGREALARDLMPIIQSLGSITVAAAQKALEPTHRLTLGGTRQLLSYLVEIGLLISDEARVEPHSGITANRYSLVAPPDSDPAP